MPDKPLTMRYLHELYYTTHNHYWPCNHAALRDIIHSTKLDLCVHHPSNTTTHGAPSKFACVVVERMAKATPRNVAAHDDAEFVLITIRDVYGNETERRVDLPSTSDNTALGPAIGAIISEIDTPIAALDIDHCCEPVNCTSNIAKAIETN